MLWTAPREANILQLNLGRFETEPLSCMPSEQILRPLTQQKWLTFKSIISHPCNQGIPFHHLPTLVPFFNHGNLVIKPVLKPVVMPFVLRCRCNLFSITSGLETTTSKVIRHLHRFNKKTFDLTMHLMKRTKSSNIRSKLLTLNIC